LKIYKKKKCKSYSSIEEKTKKIGGFSFDVEENLDVKKIAFEKSKFSCDLNVSVLEVDKSKIKILLSIEKPKAKIEGSI
jgi:hypothetical protein